MKHSPADTDGPIGITAPPILARPVAVTRDDARDALTIEGREYGGDFFRFFGRPDHDGVYFQMAMTEHGWAIRQLETRWSRLVFWLRWEPAHWWYRHVRRPRRTRGERP